jgi:peptide/nickel transport system substrate-binding protein
MAGGLALSAILVLSACAAEGVSSKPADGPNTTPKKGGTVHFLATSDLSHLDPAKGFDGGVSNFYRLIYRTLTTPSTGEGAKGAQIVPDLATDLGTSSNGATTWTFKLKDHLFFEDGSPITSGDIKFGVERSFDPELGIGSPYAKKYLADPDSYQGPYKSKGDFKSVETPDDKTIIFHLNQPMADFGSVVSQPTFVPVPQKAQLTATSLDTKPIASGPYKVATYQRGSSLTLVRNDHWDPKSDQVRKAYPDGFEWSFGLDRSTIDQRMIAGQGTDVDALAGTVQPASIARLQTPEIKRRMVTGITGCTTYMGLNTTKPHMSDVRVRQAISYAINKQTVLNVSGGSTLTSVAHKMLPPTLAGAREFNLYPSQNDEGDVAKAKALLTEAGLANGFEFTLDIRSHPTMQAQAEAIQQALAKVGVTMKLNLIDPSTYYEVIGTRSQQHDAAITGWCPDWPSGATFLPPLFDGTQIYDKGNSNLAQLNDPAVNDRIVKIAAMTDVSAQNEAYGQLDEQILKLAPVVPLLHDKVVLVVGANIAGAYSHAGFSGGVDLTSVGLTDPKK